MTYKKKVTRAVDRVIDGDTFSVKRKVNGSNRVRVGGIDTPERGQRGYGNAKSALSRRIVGKKVTISISAKDKFGRVVASRVTQNRKNIGKSMKRYQKRR